MSELQYHVDGKLVAASDATVNVRDRGFMYGDAVFETLRVYGGTVFEWKAHADRLRQSSETLGFADALPENRVLRERIDETLVANELADAYVKLSVTRGVQPGKLTPDPAVDPTIIVFVSPLGRGGTGGQRVWDEPATLSTVSQRKPPASALPAGAKTHNYLNSILARLELRGTDSDEAVVLSVDGLLTEGATSNLFFLRDGVLCTPAESVPILPGITRDVVLDIASEQEISVETGAYGPECLDEATEVFVTNSTWEIRPVTAIDDRTYDIGPVTRELQRAFDERIEQCYE